MIKASLPLLRLASTHHGMRRILKRPIPAADFIRKAVIAGIYKNQDDDSRNPRKLGLNGKSDRLVFPVEYEILTLNPAIPLPPKVSKKILRQQAHAARKKDGVERLAKKYMARQTHQGRSDSEANIDDYYRRLLGIPAPIPSSAMGQKSAIMNKAYAVALKQQQLLRSNSALTEEESLQVVEDLLKQDAKEERHQTRILQNEIQEWKQHQEQNKEQQKLHDQQDKKNRVLTSDDTASKFSSSKSDEEEYATSSVPSILHSKPRTIQGIAVWSKRLQAVPYKDWTVGASMSLDHFIAVAILNISDATWDALLEGSDPSLTSIGNDITMTRHALFPETAPDEDHDVPSFDDLIPEADSKETDEVGASIDELLASLGDFDDGEFAVEAEAEKPDFGSHDLPQLRAELQIWRSKQMETDYDDWSDADKREFTSWLKSYVSNLQSDDFEEIDWTATRQALLAFPATSEEESKELWDSIRDQTQAEIYLENLSQKVDEGKLEPFWSLPYSEQVRRLTALGSLRPMLDEYADPNHRRAFLERHADKLLEGLELEHIIKDAKGPIAGSDLQKLSLMQGVGEKDRFSIQKLPYGSDKRGRQLLIEWNRFKVGRALYEEHLFKKGTLGLRYDQKPRTKNNK